MYHISRTFCRSYPNYVNANKFKCQQISCNFVINSCCGSKRNISLNGLDEGCHNYGQRKKRISRCVIPCYSNVHKLRRGELSSSLPCSSSPYKLQRYYSNSILFSNSILIHRHSFHVSFAYFDENSKVKQKVVDHEEKSKVEEYVEHQKQKLEKKKKIIEASKKFQEAFVFKVDPTLGEMDNVKFVQGKSSRLVVSKKPLSLRIKEEIKHYANGFKLLYLDVKIAARLLWQTLNGKTLTRREEKQFKRTVADLFRLVPFSVFLIIPFMEFLLPVAIKLFPGMLPSTFEDSKTRDDKRRASLKMKLQMAEFLQDTIEEMSVTEKGTSNEKLKEFGKFIRKTRTSDNPPSNGEIIKYSQIFEDEITLDNLPYDQLKALCLIMMVSPIGPSELLRFQIRLKLRELKADDQLIRREGIDSLSDEELQNACISRGMRSLGVSKDRLKANLKQWLELSLDQKIPGTLLLLSRTFFMQYDRVDEQLKLTISQLPERLIDEMELKIGAVEGESVDLQTIIDIINHEEEQIKSEKIQREKDKAEDDKVKLRDPLSSLMEEQISKEELLKVKETLSLSEKEKLDEIKAERAEYIEDVEELKLVKKGVAESKASSRLGKRIDALLKDADSSLKKLEVKTSGVPISYLDSDEDGVVTTAELFEAINKLRNAPTMEKTVHFIKTIDEDSDGFIDLDEMRSAISLLANEDVELNEAQIKQVLSLMKDIEKVFLVEQMINKRKTNYLIKLLPTVYSRKF